MRFNVAFTAKEAAQYVARFRENIKNEQTQSIQKCINDIVRQMKEGAERGLTSGYFDLKEVNAIAAQHLRGGWSEKEITDMIIQALKDAGYEVDYKETAKGGLSSPNREITVSFDPEKLIQGQEVVFDVDGWKTREDIPEPDLGDMDEIYASREIANDPEVSDAEGREPLSTDLIV